MFSLQRHALPALLFALAATAFWLGSSRVPVHSPVARSLAPQRQTSAILKVSAHRTIEQDSTGPLACPGGAASLAAQESNGDEEDGGSACALGLAALDGLLPDNLIWNRPDPFLAPERAAVSFSSLCRFRC